MTGPVRFAIIGMGGIGMHHAKYIAMMPGAELAGFSTRDEGRRAEAGATFPQARGFGSHRELLAAGCSDAVVICTPHKQHVAAVVDALEAGQHALVEKPLAVTISECRRALEAARRHPRQL